ncbi:60S ribosomal protein L19-3 [Heracleum sosnowskyi]|uniref:Glutathione S-transferase 3, mitochondrial n=1 Tax=Heracleum sosnowskyi TaxID=360622 RepID=A0AAD8MFB8_9APIA|nr:60S ribosomal protein L19-3 [Heracleum sosnowskyi]
MSRVEMVPKEYGYVVLMVALSGILNLWMGYQVVKARIKYNVRLPRLYALESENKDAKLFNCIQRGHQNTLEWMPLFLAFMAMGGIKHPNVSAAFGLIYVVARLFYFTGYSTGHPQKRLTVGVYNYMALVGLLLCTISCGIDLLLA